MSRGYRTRQKRIRDEKRRHDLSFGRIPEKAFRQLQAEWDREITGPPLTTLDLVRR